MVPAFELDSKDYNSLFLDFYHHGQLKALCVYNGIKRDEVWDSLNEFHLTVKSLWAAMQRRANLGAGYYDAFADEDVLDTFKHESALGIDALKRGREDGKRAGREQEGAGGRVGRREDERGRRKEVQSKGGSDVETEKAGGRALLVVFSCLASVAQELVCGRGMERVTKDDITQTGPTICIKIAKFHLFMSSMPAWQVWSLPIDCVAKGVRHHCS
eukprot:1058640-Rhodomonas_salina.2